MIGCCNNAAFAIGEFAIAYGQNFHKYIPDFAKKFSQILSGSQKVFFFLIFFLKTLPPSYIDR